MATGTVVPVSEYLKTMYRPDWDYVDGEVQERNLGELLYDLRHAIHYNQHVGRMFLFA